MIKKMFRQVFLRRLPLKTLICKKNEVNLQNNGVNLQINPQSKVKKSKEKESKEEGDAIGSVFQTFEHCGFKIDGYTGEELMSLIDEYSAGWVQEAIKRATDRGKRTMSYIKGILRSWDSKGAIDDIGETKPKGKTKTEPRRYKEFKPDEAPKDTISAEEQRRNIAALRAKLGEWQKGTDIDE